MKNKGFTFVELLVVMVFMGLMILVVFPTVTSMMKQSEDNKYKAFLSDVFLATEAYVQKNIDNYQSLQETGGKVYVYMNQLVTSNLLKSTLVNPNYCDEDNNCGPKKISSCDENGENCVIDNYIIIVTKTEDGIYSYELIIGTIYYANQVEYTTDFDESITNVEQALDALYNEL